MKTIVKFFTTSILFIGSIYLPTISAQTNRQPNVTAKFEYAKMRDADLLKNIKVERPFLKSKLRQF